MADYNCNEEHSADVVIDTMVEDLWRPEWPQHSLVVADVDVDIVVDVVVGIVVDVIDVVIGIVVFLYPSEHKQRLILPPSS